MIPKEIIDLNDKLCKFDYGVVYKNKVIKGEALDHFDYGNKYRTLSLDDFVKYQIGICWDFAHYECNWFKDHGYKYQSYYLQVDDSRVIPTHSFTTFQLPNSDKYYYFESSWSKYAGIEEFNTIKDLLDTVRNRYLSAQYDPILLIMSKVDLTDNSWEGLNPIEYMAKAMYNDIPIYRVVDFYRGSHIMNLKSFDPLDGSHHKNRIYVSDDPRFSACYGAQWNNKTAHQGTWDNWKTITFGYTNEVKLTEPCTLYRMWNNGKFIKIKRKEYITYDPIFVTDEIHYKSFLEMLEDHGVEVITHDEYMSRLEMKGI